MGVCYGCEEQNAIYFIDETPKQEPGRQAMEEAGFSLPFGRKAPMRLARFFLAGLLLHIQLWIVGKTVSLNLRSA